MSTGRLFEGWMPTVVSLRRVCKRHCLMHNVDVMRGVSSQGGVRAVVRVAKASRPPRAPGRAAQCRQAHTHTHQRRPVHAWKPQGQVFHILSNILSYGSMY
jgi:hypothetical protein